MKIKGCVIIVLVLSVTLTSCEYHDISIHHTPMDSIYLVLQDTYYWNDNLPSLDKYRTGRFASPSELIFDIRNYSPNNPDLNIPTDRWSFALPQQQWTDMLKGESSDFGVGMRFVSEEDLRISWVQPNSNSGKAGLVRGTRVLKINNIKPAYSIISTLLEQLEQHATITMQIQENNGTVREVEISKSEYSLNSILKHDVFQYQAKKVGYLQIITFNENLNKELVEAFQVFRESSIDELIIDLRYNGGGLLSAMEELGAYIVPENHINEIFYKILYNKKYTMFNENIFFKINPNRIPLKKVHFITGTNTASASEMLIHAFKPYLSVETVGKPTQGKLYGMQPRSSSGYVIVPLTFVVYNAIEKDRDPNFRILPDVDLDDDVRNDFTFNEANIHFILTGKRPNGRLGHSDFEVDTKQNMLGNSSLNFCVK